MLKKISDDRCIERGAAMLEFAICIPLLVFLLQGVIFICSSLSNLISVSQMAYSSAMAGIEVAPGASADAMGRRASSILGASKGQFVGQTGNYPFGAQPFPEAPADGSRLVRVNLSPKLKSELSGPFAALIGAKITAPLLYVDKTISGVLSRPANPVGRVYDCDGGLTSAPPGQCSNYVAPPPPEPPPAAGGCRKFCFIDVN